MGKGRKIYLFVLGTIFGLSLAFLGIAVLLSQDTSGLNQYTGLSKDNIISSLKSKLQSISLGGSCEKYEKFDTVWNVLEHNQYYETGVDFNKAIDNALKGFVDAAGDRYTIYMTTEENESFQKGISGEGESFEGIGAIVSKKADGVLIENVIKRGPAYNAGIMPLDLIIEVDGKSTQNMSLSDAVKMMRGEEGTTVNLKIYRESTQEVFEVEITRQEINVPSVLSKVTTLTGGVDIGYIEISSIGQSTERMFQEAVNDLKERDIQGIVLDLRGNGGGLLPIAVEIASHFIPQGQVIVTTQYRVYPAETYESYGYSDLQDMPVVVLIDGYSASAAEIITMALKDQLDVPIIGSQSFGKGTIQTIYDLQDGSSLKYTIGKWFPPESENVEGEGITPDIQVEFDLEEYKETNIDKQLNTAEKELLKLIGN